MMGTTTARRIRMEPILFHTINGIFMLLLAIVTLISVPSYINDFIQ